MPLGDINTQMSPGVKNIYLLILITNLNNFKRMIRIISNKIRDMNSCIIFYNFQINNLQYFSFSFVLLIVSDSKFNIDDLK